MAADPQIETIGIVTVTYNSREVICPFLTSILSQSYSHFRLYIIDNLSVDNTLQCIADFRDPRIRVISNQQNLGFAEGSNQGITAALAEGCDVVLLINNDTEFGPSLLATLVEGLCTHACDMTAPKIVYYDNPEQIWSAGGGFHSLKGYAAFHYGLNERDRGQFDRPRAVKHSPACCLLIRKEVFAAIGLMDPRYFVYLDDTDFCFRATQAGLTIFYLPSAIVFHKASSLTGGVDSDFSVRYRTRNQIYFMLKNLGVWRGSLYLPAFQLYQLLKLLSRKIGLRGFALREKAFIEGLQVWIKSRSST